jgi:hypothetical protein
MDRSRVGFAVIGLGVLGTLAWNASIALALVDLF